MRLRMFFPLSSQLGLLRCRIVRPRSLPRPESGQAKEGGLRIRVSDEASWESRGRVRGNSFRSSFTNHPFILASGNYTPTRPKKTCNREASSPNNAGSLMGENTCGKLEPLAQGGLA
jgi:hypothetical protein